MRKLRVLAGLMVFSVLILSFNLSLFGSGEIETMKIDLPEKPIARCEESQDRCRIGVWKISSNTYIFCGKSRDDKPENLSVALLMCAMKYGENNELVIKNTDLALVNVEFGVTRSFSVNGCIMIIFKED